MKSIREILEKKGVNVAFDLTCTGLGRKVLAGPGNSPLQAMPEDF